MDPPIRQANAPDLQNLPFRGSRLDDGRICMQDMLNLPPSRDGT